MYGQMALNIITQCFFEGHNRHFVPEKLMVTGHSIMAHRAIAGVVDPGTGKTLTKYKDIIKSPTLHDTYVKAMCKELGRISQGYGSTMGTNCVKWMIHN